MATQYQCDRLVAQTCQKELEEAQQRLTLAVIALYPEGSNVKVRLSGAPNHGPTWGRVIGHGTGKFAGEVKLRLETRTRLVRDFGWERIES